MIDKLETITNREVRTYFESLGYFVSWDYQISQSKYWHEIYSSKGEKLICQIDCGIPLSVIKEDLIAIRENRHGTNEFDYIINAPESPEFNNLLEKIQ